MNSIVNKIEIHPLADDPHKAWLSIESKIEKKLVEPLPLETPIYPDKVIKQSI